MADITAYFVGANDSQTVDPPCPCAGRTYYGSAEPEGKTIILGGMEVVVGGWVAYEADRRRALWEAKPHSQAAQPLSRYGGRTYITGQDALESLIGARAIGGSGANAYKPSDPLARAAGRLAAALDTFETVVTKNEPTSLWARLGIPSDTPFAVSMVSAEDIRYITPETDVYELHQAAEAASLLASPYARDDEHPTLRPPRPPGVLPLLPSREVPTRGTAPETINRRIVRLENDTVPRATAIETYRGDVAAVFDASAAVLERAMDAGA
jgi:hypothetical protein